MFEQFFASIVIARNPIRAGGGHLFREVIKADHIVALFDPLSNAARGLHAICVAIVKVQRRHLSTSQFMTLAYLDIGDLA